MGHPDTEYNTKNILDKFAGDAQHLSPNGHMYDLAASTYARHTGIRTAHIALWEILNKTGMNSWITCECRPRQNGSWCGRTREFEPTNPTLITTRDEKNYLDRNWAYFAKPKASRGPMPAA